MAQTAGVEPAKHIRTMSCEKLPLSSFLYHSVLH